MKHQEIDARSLAMHRLAVDKIRRDPALFERVCSTLQRWRVIVCPSSQPYLQEWEQLINAGMERCLEMAVEDSQRATALRQSSPFCGVLTEPERLAFLKEWKRRRDLEQHDFGQDWSAPEAGGQEETAMNKLEWAKLKNLRQHHIEAAMAMKLQHGMVVDVDNLHAIIVYWPAAVSVAAGYQEELVENPDITTDHFRPIWLIEYLRGRAQAAAARQAAQP